MGRKSNMTRHNFVDILIGLIVVNSLFEVVVAGKTHFRHMWKAILVMTRESMSGLKGYLLAGSVFMLVRGLFPSFLSNWIPPMPRYVWIVGSIGILIRVLRPPAILFLAASKPRALELLADMQVKVTPLKIVHLLQAGTAGPFLSQQIGADGYRVSVGWQRTVREFSKIASLIIFDARTPSPAVTEELQHNIHSGESVRTFIIFDEQSLNEHGEIPALHGVSFPHESSTHLLTVREFTEAISTVGWGFLASSETDLVKYFERRINRVQRLRAPRAGALSACAGCKVDLPEVTYWGDLLTLDERIELESFTSCEHVFQCRKCGQRYCSTCAVDCGMRCAGCDTLSLRTGYIDLL
jgi:hypothetical protein